VASPAVAERPAARSAPAARPPRAAAPVGPATAPAGSMARPTDAAGPRVRLGAAPSAEEVSLKGSATFAPPQSVVDYLGTQPGGRGDVAVRFPGVAAGVIQVQKHGDKYSTPDELQAIDVQHPALAPLSSIHLAPVLAVEIKNSVVVGYVTVSAGKKPVRSPQELIAQIRRYPTALGLLGLGDLRTPAFENKLSGGALSLKTELSFKLGGYLDGTGSFGLTDDAVTFTAHAHASVRDVAELVLDIERRPDGVIAGRAEIPVKLKNFSGNFVLTLAGGVVDVIGTFRYATEKLSGEVTLLITDAQTARNVAYQHLPPEAIDASAREAAGGSTVAAAPTSAGPKPGPRAVAGWGTLDVHYSDWLTGKALVVIDGKGFVTVVGKIAPPAKVEFPQTKLDYERKIFGLEVRASYGLPYVGNVFLFAGVSLFAIAKISPLTLSKIEIDGRYSTDPAIFNSFSLSANLSISALAAVRLRAEGGVGIEILAHDIKIGAALTATAGIRGYVDATPVIGYRELADPKAGRRGEFYLHGEAEFAAQAFLAMGGELFVKLETPWWSPVSDHTWTWPLGQLVYPLPGEIGFGADIDYIFGSGKLPTISPKKVDFNADRFMSDLMDDNVPHGSPTEQKKPGRWNERQKAPPVPPAPPQVKDTKGPGKKKDDKPAKDAGKTLAAGMKAVGDLKKRGEAQPFAAEEMAAALKAIKAQYGFSVLEAKPAGDNWEIVARFGKDPLTKPVRIKRAAGGAATPSAATPALPEKTFDAGGEKHRLFIVVQGTRAIPMIASEAKRVKDFLAVASKDPSFKADMKRFAALKAADPLADAVDKLANEVEALLAKGKPVEAKRKDLGDKEKELADQLHIALGGIDINELDKGYLLEGVVGTYGSVPEQKKDRLTADHQPQDAVMKLASQLKHVSGVKLFTGLQLSHYATNDGWAINLHFQRHIWGLTYGKPPRTAVVNDLKAAAQMKNILQARNAVMVTLRKALDEDATEIEKAVTFPIAHDVWSDLDKKIPGPSKPAKDAREALRKRIKGRVEAGEKKLRQQPLEGFFKP
jgi:hypothetical protein